MRTSFAALLMVLASIAHAGELKLVAELPEAPHTIPRLLSAQRYVLVGVEWERDANKLLTRARYQLFDLKERKLTEAVVPLHLRPQAYLDRFGKYASPQPVHHRGEVTTFTFTERKNYKPVATFLSQFDHRTSQFSELVELVRWSPERILFDIGVDPSDTWFYFAHADSPPGEGSRRYTAFDISRVDLRTRAVEAVMRVELPRRTRPLTMGSSQAFSPDGTKLALVEYMERGTKPADPPQQVLVIDLAARKVDSYPALLTTYGLAFTRDGQSLLLGSNELGEIVRIDLLKKRVVARTQAKKLIHSFVVTPSGNSFLSISNTQLASPKVVEVRRVSDLKLQVSIPVRLLYPGTDGVSGSAIAGMNGRLLMLPFVDARGWPEPKGFRLYEIPDEVDSPSVGGPAAANLRIAQGVIRGKSYADAQKLRYAEINEPSDATFAQFSVGAGGEVCLTGILSENSDGDYQPGRTRPVVALLDEQGKARWKQVLVTPGYQDYESGAVAMTADGGCIAHLRLYRKPNMMPVSRVVKLDRAGQVLWDHHFRREGGTPIATRLELQRDGSVKVLGHIQYLPDETRVGWKATLGADGRLLSEEYPK